MGSAARFIVTLAVAAGLVAGALYLRSRDRSSSRHEVPAACEPPGQGEVSGQVGPHRLAIASAWYDEFLAGAYVIVLDEDAGSSCGDPGREGRHLVIWLPCGRVTPGGYEIRPRDAGSECEVPFAAVALEGGDGADLGSAASGRLEVESIAGCVRGSLEAEFPGGSRISARFAAPVCD